MPQSIDADKAIDSGPNSETQSWDSPNDSLNEVIYQYPLINDDKDHHHHFNGHHHHRHHGPYSYAKKLTKKLAAPFFMHGNGQSSSADGSNDLLPFYDARTGDQEEPMLDPPSKVSYVSSDRKTRNTSENSNSSVLYPSVHGVEFKHSRSASSMTNLPADSTASLLLTAIESSADKRHLRSHSAVNLSSSLGRRFYDSPVRMNTPDEDLMSSSMTPIALSPSLRYSRTSNTPSSSEFASKRNSFGDSTSNSPRLLARDSFGQVNTSSRSSGDTPDDRKLSSSHNRLKSMTSFPLSSGLQSQSNISHESGHSQNVSGLDSSHLSSYASADLPSSGSSRNFIAPEIRKKFEDLNDMINANLAKCINSVDEDNTKLFEDVHSKYEKLDELNRQLEATIKDIQTYSGDVDSIKENDLRKLKSSDLFTNLNDLNARLTVVKSSLKKDEETLTSFGKEILALEQVKKRNVFTQKTRGNIILIIFGCLILVLIIKTVKHILHSGFTFDFIRSLYSKFAEIIH